ncbi:flagellar hook-basal body complex protein FliE [Nitrospira sp. Kam-Ns4a]
MAKSESAWLGAMRGSRFAPVEMAMDDIRIIAPAPVPIGPALADGPSRGAPPGGFRELLKDAIAQANAVQLDAMHAVDALVSGDSQNLHQTMIALQKADISFQLMMQIRNKIVSAYEEIQRMQI